MGCEDRNKKYQGGRIEGSPVQTHDIQHCPRTFYFICCKVGVRSSYRPTLSSTQYPFSHKDIMDTEIDIFLENFTDEDPESLMDHIQRMSSGEAPFFPTTLSLLYGKLAEKSAGPTAPVTCRLICPRCNNSASLEDLSGYLSCRRGHKVKIDKRKPKQKSPPCMKCPICNTPRTTPSNSCVETTCRAIFV